MMLLKSGDIMNSMGASCRTQSTKHDAAQYTSYDIMSQGTIPIQRLHYNNHIVSQCGGVSLLQVYPDGIYPARCPTCV